MPKERRGLMSERTLFCICCVLVTSAVLWLLHSRDITTWLAYLWPTRLTWDLYIHNRNNSDGGVWRYHTGVHAEISCYVRSHHGNYSSLIDVASNMGFMLEELQRHRPNAVHFGTDISSRMAALTSQSCGARCHTAQFDISDLMRGGAFPFPAADVVIVSDVLYYMPYAHWPPALLNAQLVPSWCIRAAQRRLFERLTNLARLEVIFSDHQGNPAVGHFLQSSGARFESMHGVWVAPGTAMPSVTTSSVQSPKGLNRRQHDESSRHQRADTAFRRCMLEASWSGGRARPVRPRNRPPLSGRLLRTARL